MICVHTGFGEPVCTQQCGACAEWDRRGEQLRRTAAPCQPHTPSPRKTP